MNREDIIKLAWEADKFANKSAAPSGSDWWQLERDTHLAALVAAAARAEEREACASILDAKADMCVPSSTFMQLLRSNASAIRARGQA